MTDNRERELRERDTSRPELRRPDLNDEHAPSPAEGALDRPREGTSIPAIAVVLAVLIVGGGLLLYGRSHDTNTAQLTPPAPQSGAPATPQTQQPTQSNPAGTR